MASAQAPGAADTSPTAAEVAAAEAARTKEDDPEGKGGAADNKQTSEASQICSA